MAANKVQDYLGSFDEADKNKDNKLSYAEVTTILRNKHGVSTKDAMILFNADDTNMDGFLSREEFGAAVEKISPPKQRENALRCAFDQLDADKSGYISPEEMLGVFQLEMAGVIPPEKVRGLMVGVQLDPDGKVSYEEFLHILGIDEAGDQLREIFKKLDVDNNGTATIGEIFEASAKNQDLADYRKTLQGVIEECSEDADGKLTYAEFLAAWDKQKTKFTPF